MSVTVERGILVKFDEGMIARMDHETEVRRAVMVAANGGQPVEKLHRTEVIRALLTYALDHFAAERGEEVPKIVEFAAVPRVVRAAPARPEPSPPPAPAVVDAAPASEPEAPEPAPAPLVEPEKVQVGTISGEGSLGSHVRMVGVRV